MGPQLEGIIKQKMAPNLIDKVDFSAEVDLFVDLVAYALKARTARIFLYISIFQNFFVNLIHSFYYNYN